MTSAPAIPFDPDITSRPSRDADAVTERRQRAATVWVFRNDDWLDIRADERFRLHRTVQP